VERRQPGECRADQFARETARIIHVYGSYDSDLSYRSRHRQDKEGATSAWSTLLSDIGGVLYAEGYESLAGKRVLDVGCGYGDVLACMKRWGARPGDLVGIDLLPWRVDAARLRYPDLRFDCQNATSLEFEANSFDLVLCFTVLSSVLDEFMARRIALEIDRVLTRDGAVLWYDLRYPVPFNRRLQAMGWKRIERLFPEYRLRLRRVTLLPPLNRTLVRYKASSKAFPWRSTLLKGHYLGFISRRT
jgi:SAM-dependent methyltransferase